MTDRYRTSTGHAHSQGHRTTTGHAPDTPAKEQVSPPDTHRTQDAAPLPDISPLPEREGMSGEATPRWVDASPLAAAADELDAVEDFIDRWDTAQQLPRRAWLEPPAPVDCPRCGQIVRPGPLWQQLFGAHCADCVRADPAETAGDPQ